MMECTVCEEMPENAWLPVLAFVPVQELAQVYEVESGFSRGTIFPVLDKPFLAGGCAR